MHKINYYNTGQKNRADEFLEVGQGSHDLINSALLEDETLIIIDSDILKLKEK
jgi:hypothetical protein